MGTEFRKSRFIDFNIGQVFVQPMEFMRQIPGPWTLTNKIDVFECRVEVWQLGVAVEMLKEIERNKHPSIWSHSAFGLIAVVFTYFEMIGKTLNPKSRCSGTTAPDFNYGFCDVYPEYQPATGDYQDANLPEVRGFRDRIRNGMYHLAGTKTYLVIHNNPEITKDFVVDGESHAGHLVYRMNPHRVTRTIVDHFPDFVARLRDSKPEFADMRRKFLEFFDTFYNT